MRNNIEQRRRLSPLLLQQRHKKTPTENDIGEGKMEKKTKQNLLHIPSEVGNKKPKHKPSK